MKASQLKAHAREDGKIWHTRHRTRNMSVLRCVYSPSFRRVSLLHLLFSLRLQRARRPALGLVRLVLRLLRRRRRR